VPRSSLRYTVAFKLTSAENCHCSMCRKAHGSAFSSNALVPTSALTAEGAKHLSSYRSSPNREMQFCSKCGSQLFIKRLNASEATVITLGTLDDDPKLSPNRHVFTASKAPWHDLDEGPSRPKIETALEALRAVMNCIRSFYLGSTMKYKLFICRTMPNILYARCNKACDIANLSKKGSMLMTT
jgi:hypothetical protein